MCHHPWGHSHGTASPGLLSPVVGTPSSSAAGGTELRAQGGTIGGTVLPASVGLKGVKWKNACPEGPPANRAGRGARQTLVPATVVTSPCGLLVRHT